MWEWLLRPVKTAREGLKLFIIALIGSLTWSIAMSTSLRPMLRPAAGFDPLALGWAVVPLIAVAVFAEEVIRLFPLAIIARLFGRNAGLVLGTALVTAALFGAAHVSNGLPLWFALMCQGATGFVMNLLYLKVGGLHRRMFRGFLFALAFHLTFDLVIIVPALLLRQT